MQYFIFKKQLRDVCFLSSSSFFLFLHVLSCQSKQSLNYIIFLIIFKRPYIDILIIVSFFPLKLLDSSLSLFFSVKKSHFQAVIFSNYQFFSLPSSKRWLPHFTHAHTNSWFFFFLAQQVTSDLRAPTCHCVIILKDEKGVRVQCQSPLNRSDSCYL
jgi:hypothetical protein